MKTANNNEDGTIYVKLCERIYNDTTAPVAIGDTVIYNKFKGETPRRAVITGYNDTIKMYFLECEDGQNIATGRDGFATLDNQPAESVPDVVILSSSDEYTREKFRERHEKFYKLSSYWKGEEVNTDRESDLKKHYDRESLAVHFLLSHELFYSWEDNRHREDCLNDVRVIYQDMTADELHNIRDKYAPAISEIYG